VNVHLEDPAYLETLRAQMLRFARLQLGQDDAAEDAVQEALVGALRDAGAFGGRAAFRTWVFGILKHKIADELRRRARVPLPQAQLARDEDQESLDELFDARGHWQDHALPRGWSLPESTLADQQFWRVFEACLDKLPPAQGRVFMMREFVGLDSEEICKTSGLTQTNLYVLLHRARLRLRECLAARWFGESA
jgi:RNA polymerase sigma-70 factor (ECF subfamily)